MKFPTLLDNFKAISKIYVLCYMTLFIIVESYTQFHPTLSDSYHVEYKGLKADCHILQRFEAFHPQSYIAENNPMPYDGMFFGR